METFNVYQKYILIDFIDEKAICIDTFYSCISGKSAPFFWNNA